MKSPATVAALLLFAASCGPGNEGPGDHQGSPDAARAIDGAPESPPDAAGPRARFVAMGDMGTGGEGQYQVAAAIRDTCAADGCDFVLLLGDNIYDKGVSSGDDEAWQEKFVAPYAEIDLPFYATLGNHDYGGKYLFFSQNGRGNEFSKGPHEVEYSEVQTKFRMPATFYTQVMEPVGLVVLDSNSLVWDNDDNGDQKGWIEGAMAEVEGQPWIIAMGHHTYRSNGEHGNAGEYGDFGVPDGQDFKDFMDEHVCGRADVYLCGHDHNRQWIDEPDQCPGTELIVSGAGSGARDLPGDNAVRYQDATTPGFLYVDVDEHTFTARFIDATGAVNYEYTLTK